jgi:hypothetical protein
MAFNAGLACVFFAADNLRHGQTLVGVSKKMLYTHHCENKATLARNARQRLAQTVIEKKENWGRVSCI